jgi:hypothetical protein
MVPADQNSIQREDISSGRNCHIKYLFLNVDSRLARSCKIRCGGFDAFGGGLPDIFVSLAATVGSEFAGTWKRDDMQSTIKPAPTVVLDAQRRQFRRIDARTIRTEPAPEKMPARSSALSQRGLPETGERRAGRGPFRRNLGERTEAVRVQHAHGVHDQGRRKPAR